MSHRKIISLGSSYAVTLPGEWIKDNNLEKGDLVEYYVQGDNRLLFVTGKAKKKDPELLLEIDDSKSLESIYRELIAGFINGYTTIILKSRSLFTEKQQIFLRESSRHLFMMIVKADSSSMTLETLIDVENTSIASNIEKIYKITEVMCNDVLLCLETPNERLLSSITVLENDVDQLRLLLSRLISVSMMDPGIASNQDLDCLDCMYYQTLVNRIERVADHLCHVALNIMALHQAGKTIPKDVREAFISIAEKVFASYDESVMSFVTEDLKSTDDIIDSEKRITLFLDSIMSSLHDQTPEKDLNIYYVHISEGIRKISHYAADIAEITIDRAYKKIKHSTDLG